MPKHPSGRLEDRIYWRTRQNGQLAYADYRDFADVGGKQQALIAPGERGEEHMRGGGVNL